MKGEKTTENACGKDMLGYGEKRERVRDMFLKKADEEKLLFSAMENIKNVYDRCDILSDTIVKCIPYELAVYGGEPYVFNGRFYERVSVDNIKYGLDEFLKMMKVKARDRSEKMMYIFVKRVLDRIRDHELSPRLSLMCFRNCVVDMNNLKKYAFGPEHDVVKMYPFKYDRKEIYNCRIWNAFLGENYLLERQYEDCVLPEKFKRRLLQMFLGACLVDRKRMSFEYFMILQGTGANGKSVIQKVLNGMFGDEEMLNIKLSQFGRAGDEGMRAIASMEGKRLLHCTESSKSDFRDTSTLKAISSGEPLAGRKIGGNIQQFTRPPLLICNSNYRWKMEDFANKDDSADISMQRRAVIVNFEKSIPVEKRDAMLSERLKEEYAGIFAWMVKGLVDLKKSKWKLPDYQSGNIDNILDRINGDVNTNDGKKVSGSVAEWLLRKTCHTFQYKDGEKFKEKNRSASDLYWNYTMFCDRIGITAVTKCKFGRDLSNLGYRKTSGKEQMYRLFVEDENIAENFDKYVPGLNDIGVIKDPYSGYETSIEEFVEGENGDDGKEA